MRFEYANRGAASVRCYKRKVVLSCVLRRSFISVPFGALFREITDVVVTNRSHELMLAKEIKVAVDQVEIKTGYLNVLRKAVQSKELVFGKQLPESKEYGLCIEIY